MKIKVKQDHSRSYSPTDYMKVINLSDFRDLALFFSDLVTLFDAPVDKALVEMRKDKTPFW